MTETRLNTLLVTLFDNTPTLKALCPKGLYWRRGLPNNTIAATGTATFEKLDSDHQHNTSTDHPAELVFLLSGWFADDATAFKFRDLVTEVFQGGDAIDDCMILVTNSDVIDTTDQTWQGMVELTITAEIDG